MRLNKKISCKFKKIPHACVVLILLLNVCSLSAQKVSDDFEGNGNIQTWFGDDCNFTLNFNNPFSNGLNTSNKVLKYSDIGGQYANVRFDVTQSFDLAQYPIYRLKIFIPSNGQSGAQTQQVSLKLQNGSLAQAWTTQCEIVKPLQLDVWQIVSFDFKSDPYSNLDPNSVAPTLRTDFSRVVIQVNGENNNSSVLAYIDDFVNDSAAKPVKSLEQLVWSDEFNGNGFIDTLKWFQQTQLPNGGSWFNGEIQHYTKRQNNASLSNGTLKINALKESFTDQGVTKNYTSARLNSKFAFKYGRVEIRAKLPSGTGTWPALWMLGKNIDESGGYWAIKGYGNTAWPACGEIDIMEHWGSNQNFVQSAIHTPSSFGNTSNLGGRNVAGVSTDFHVYGMLWTPEKLEFTVDGVVHYTYSPSSKNPDTWPFDLEQYLLLNLAILPSISNAFSSATLEVDYVRIYQDAPSSIAREVLEPQIIVCSNPFTSSLMVLFEGLEDQEAEVKIWSQDGRTCRQMKVNMLSNVLRIDDLYDLSNGLYYLSINLAGKTYNLLVAKQS